MRKKEEKTFLAHLPILFYNVMIITIDCQNSRYQQQ